MSSAPATSDSHLSAGRRPSPRCFSQLRRTLARPRVPGRPELRRLTRPSWENRGARSGSSPSFRNGLGDTACLVSRGRVENEDRGQIGRSPSGSCRDGAGEPPAAYALALIKPLSYDTFLIRVERGPRSGTSASRWTFSLPAPPGAVQPGLLLPFVEGFPSMSARSRGDGVSHGCNVSPWDASLGDGKNRRFDPLRGSRRRAAAYRPCLETVDAPRYAALVNQLSSSMPRRTDTPAAALVEIELVSSSDGGGLARDLDAASTPGAVGDENSSFPRVPRARPCEAACVGRGSIPPTRSSPFSPGESGGIPRSRSSARTDGFSAPPTERSGASTTPEWTPRTGSWRRCSSRKKTTIACGRPGRRAGSRRSRLRRASRPQGIGRARDRSFYR